VMNITRQSDDRATKTGAEATVALGGRARHTAGLQERSTKAGAEAPVTRHNSRGSGQQQVALNKDRGRSPSDTCVSAISAPPIKSRSTKTGAEAPVTRC